MSFQPQLQIEFMKVHVHVRSSDVGRTGVCVFVCVYVLCVINITKKQSSDVNWNKASLIYVPHSPLRQKYQQFLVSLGQRILDSVVMVENFSLDHLHVFIYWNGHVEVATA